MPISETTIARMTANPRGPEATAAIEVFDAWAECLNNILDIVAESDLDCTLRTRIRMEAMEWGLEVDDATGEIITGIDTDE